ncbi:MAG: trypsin-like peptidase domain-containing protein [Rhodobacter sp.]|nr:trypsin-like peptidase domain-containing protein [Rhodobacter sp.]
MRRRAALAGLLLALCAATGLEAEPTGLEPLTRRDQLLGWEAVGRVDLGEDSFCTGALIATDLVLTAAHCVFDNQGRPVDPAEMTFRAGYAEGEAIAEARVRRTVAHPGYDPVTPVSPDNVRHDVALLELVQPIPAAVAAPYSVVAPGRGDAVSVVSYAKGREEMLSWQRECAVLDRGDGLIAMDCDVTFGASGAPVFDRSGSRARIVSIISAGGPTDKGQVAYGMDLPGVVRDLKGLLSAGRPLAVAGAAAAAAEAAPGVRRLGVGTGDSRDIGARFVTPKAVEP